METCGSGGGVDESWEFENGQIRAFPSWSSNGHCLDLAGGLPNTNPAVIVAR
jgi:hypothetical protein